MLNIASSNCVIMSPIWSCKRGSSTRISSKLYGAYSSNNDREFHFVFYMIPMSLITFGWLSFVRMSRSFSKNFGVEIITPSMKILKAWVFVLHLCFLLYTSPHKPFLIIVPIWKSSLFAKYAAFFGAWGYIQSCSLYPPYWRPVHGSSYKCAIFYFNQLLFKY